LTAMSRAATIVRFFADSGVDLTNTLGGSPAARPTSFHSTARRRRSVVPVVPSSGCTSRATAPGIPAATALVNHSASTSAAECGFGAGAQGEIASAVSTTARVVLPGLTGPPRSRGAGLASPDESNETDYTLCDHESHT